MRENASSADRGTILDVTGVPVVDTQVASALLYAVSTAKMLGLAWC